MPDPADLAEMVGPRDDRALMTSIGISVLAVPGVARLEPTLRSLFHPRLPGSAGQGDRPDGIAVTTRGSTTDVTVDIATTARHSSREVAESVQRVIGGLLSSHGREGGLIKVNVLTIDPRAAAGDA